METAAVIAVAIGLIGALAIPLRGLISDSSTTPKPGRSGDEDDGGEQERADTSSIDATRESLRNIRADLASYGTAIGVASSGLIAAATLTALDDLFPAPTPGPVVWVVVCEVVSIVASATLTALFFRARRRVLLDTDLLSRQNLDSLQKTVEPQISWTPPQASQPSQTLLTRSQTSPATLKVLKDELNKTEIEILIDKLKRAAEAAGETDIEAMEKASQKLSEEAAEIRLKGIDDEKVATRKENEAARLDRKITEALLGTALLIVEKRASAVYRNIGTVALAVVSAAAIFGIFAIAGWSKGQEERINSYVTCLKDVGATAPEACQLYAPPTATSSPTATPTSTPGTTGPSSARTPSGPRS